MERSELKQRIEQYRETYLGEGAGREIFRQQLDERSEIQAIYQDIQQRRNTTKMLLIVLC